MSTPEEAMSAPGVREDVPRNPEDARSPSESPARPEEARPSIPEDQPGTTPSAEDPVQRAGLVAGDELQRLTTRWKEIQAEFVDEPKSAVAKADELVAETMERLTAMFARERTALEQRWSDSGDTSTEELRQSLRRYRALFERLLAA